MIDIMKQMPGQGMRLVETLPLLFQGENNAHRFIIVPAEGVDFTGCGIEGRFIRADNTQVSLVGGVVSGNAEIVLTGECYNVAGRAQLTVYATQNSQAVAIYAAVGNVFPSMGGAAAPENTSLLEPYPINRMMADQNLRSWWVAGETATLDYYGVTITQTGDEIEINGTLTGDNTTSDRTDWEGWPLEDTELDLTRGLTRVQKENDMLLCLQPYHMYRFCVEYISGSCDTSDLDMSLGKVIIKMTYYEQRRTLIPIQPVENDEGPYCGDVYVRKPNVPSISSQEEYEALGANVSLYGGGLILVMPQITTGHTAAFDHYRFRISIADVTGLDYKIGHSYIDW